MGINSWYGSVYKKSNMTAKMQNGHQLYKYTISNHKDNMWVAINRACLVKQSFKLKNKHQLWCKYPLGDHVIFQNGTSAKHQLQKGHPSPWWPPLHKGQTSNCYTILIEHPTHGVAQELISKSLVSDSWIHWENLNWKKWQFLPGMDLSTGLLDLQCRLQHGSRFNLFITRPLMDAWYMAIHGDTAVGNMVMQ